MHIHGLSHRPARSLLSACAALGIALALLHACASDKAEPDRQEVLRDLVSVVMLPEYEELVSASKALVKANEALEAAPSEGKLHEAQAAFRRLRGHYSQSEAFYFGPAADISITGEAIDSWPTDGEKVEALVAGDKPVDADAVARLGANLRGFPALEYLLFDSAEGDEVVLARLREEGLGARRLELAVSLAEDLSQNFERVRESWGDRDEGYAHELAEAGVDSSIFARQRDGIDEVVTGMLYVAELMVMRKLAKPLGVDTNGKPHPELEQASRSDGTVDALRDNLRGLESVYLTKRGKQSGRSLSGEVRAANRDLDERFRQSLTDALAAVDAVPGSFREALVEDTKSIELVYQKVRVVKSTIQMELAGALGASIGFGFSDTD